MKILVPTDFSENALKAALYAAEIAKTTPSSIVLVNVMEMGLEIIRKLLPLDDGNDRAIPESRKTKIENVKESILAVYGDLDVTTELADGIIADTIVDFADREKADLIIMGTKGAGNAKEMFVGTVSAAVTGRSNVPVLVIPEDFEMKQPEGILFATNHFEEDKRVLAIIIQMARIFSIPVNIIVFVIPNRTDAIEYLEKERKMDHYLSYLKMSYPDIKFNGELLEGTDFEGALALYHARHQTDVSAMVTYPKEFWEKILHGSATKKLIYHSTIPVLAIPSAEKITGIPSSANEKKLEL